MSDDHAAHAISVYGSRINRTPNLDRIAAGGMRFDSCFCTNSICSPSRASVLTGTYNHVNGVTTLDTHLDNRLVTFPKLLQADGYQTALIGKWHLGHGPAHDPTGFDHWRVLPSQGHYHNPIFLGPRRTGQRARRATSPTSSPTLCIDWLDSAIAIEPFPCCAITRRRIALGAQPRALHDVRRRGHPRTRHDVRTITRIARRSCRRCA